MVTTQEPNGHRDTFVRRARRVDGRGHRDARELPGQPRSHPSFGTVSPPVVTVAPVRQFRVSSLVAPAATAVARIQPTMITTAASHCHTPCSCQ
ncbi:hypothetical protein GCM10010145_41490 [Streptomyces ruber]|uniref:Uncharacterized protein n=1 Tax=Streptomyces ruber TaxID=83378 RepID=A0A918BJ25_9ACTN|nr:hypothetical protein GCM10010145_41490 [Streptomyces ruber]